MFYIFFSYIYYYMGLEIIHTKRGEIMNQIMNRVPVVENPSKPTTTGCTRSWDVIEKLHKLIVADIQKTEEAINQTYRVKR